MMTKREDTRRHIIAYLKAEKLTDWRRLTVIGSETPRFLYGSKDIGVFRREVVPKSVLWVVAGSPNRWGPQLVARLEIEKSGAIGDPALGVSADLLRHFRAYDWIVVGHPTRSKFFGHNDAGRALADTWVQRKAGPVRLGDTAGFQAGKPGQELQRPVLVCPGKEGPLQAVADRAGRSVFVSYKWRNRGEGSSEARERLRKILAFAHALAEEGVPVWLDRLASPRSAALEVVRRHQEDLKKLLAYGYRRCRAVVAVGSSDYGTPGVAANWTAMEWNGDLFGDTPPKSFPRVVWRLGGGPPPALTGVCHVIDQPDPVLAAKELRAWLAAQPPEVSCEKRE